MRRFKIKILTLITIVLIPFIALANTYSNIKEIMYRIKTNSESYRIICYGHIQYSYGFSHLDIKNSKQYCIYLKNVIEKDIDKVLELENIKEEVITWVKETEKIMIILMIISL